MGTMRGEEYSSRIFYLDFLHFSRDQSNHYSHHGNQSEGNAKTTCLGNKTDEWGPE